MPDLDLTLNVADRVRSTSAEGPGRRYALWVQGCPLRCPGCCNPEMLEFRPAQIMTVGDLLEEIKTTNDIEGVTYVGGEPFAQAAGLAALSGCVRRHGLSVMIFSGFTLAHLQSENRDDWNALLAETDLLIDGPYLADQHVENRRWIGSANQTANFLSQRYRNMAEDREGWDQGRNTVEIRLVDGQIQINGFPHREIADGNR